MKPIARGAGPRVRTVVGSVLLATLVGACSGGADTELDGVTIAGRVYDGGIADATVCLDVDANGRCDRNEPQTRSDAGGAYQLRIPKGSTAPLVAQVVAGVSRDSDQAQTPVPASFRMASPSHAYSPDITPYTTLVHLGAGHGLSLAEDIVRDMLGLPSRFPLALDPQASPDTLGRGVARLIVRALQATEATLDWSANDAIVRVAEALPPELAALPTLEITTKDGAPVVSREDYVDATYVLSHPATSSTRLTLNGRIRGRGHSTWEQPKKPYKVQFTRDDLYSATPDVLGMKKNRNWALLADYLDRSLMRNKLAFSLANSAAFADGMRWNPTGIHVEVTLNGDYIGVYLLAEDIRIDESRLDIREMSARAEDDEVDGGFIVEADLRLDCYNQEGLNLQYVSPLLGAKYCIDTPDEEDITPAQLAYIKAFLGEVEQAIVLGTGLSRVNAASFADWYLLNELFKNLDAPFFSSVFLWKDTDAAADPLDRLLNLGPIWDFDISAGNMNYDEVWLPTGCWVGRHHPEIGGTANWLAVMLEDRAFSALVTSRWQRNREALEQFVKIALDTYARRLQAAQQRNFTRWPILGTQLTNFYAWQTWSEEVAFLRAFMIQRIAWMDSALATPETLAAACR